MRNYKMICLHCGHVFDEKDIVEKYYDMATGTYREECPNCGSEDFEEAAYCEVCNQWFPCDEVTGKVCDKCLKKNITVQNIFKYGRARKEKVELNGFLAYVYEPDEIEHILTEHFRSLWDERKTEFVNDYITDDPEDFSKWITDEREEDK